MFPASPLHWLEAAQGRGIQPGLERMRRLLAALGNPESVLRCLHVAGTNGKGSVCAFAESVLRAMGLRTGLYTSPHLVEFAERIRINGVNASAEEIGEGIRRLQTATEGWKEADLPTYFELVTALAFDLFSRAGLDVVVLETGLGGRFDATNTAHKIACAITPIGLDHMEWLGGTLAEIAREKAGIFRSGISAVIAPQEPEAAEALTEAAARAGAPVRMMENPVDASLSLGLAGSHQRWNAALALSLIRVAGFSPTDTEVAKGLGDVSWPGRFQRLSFRGRELILDGAHNLHAARQLVLTWREVYGEKRCRLIFGALSDKDPRVLLHELLPIASEIVLVRVPSPRSAEPAELMAAIDEIPLGPSEKKPVVHIGGSLRGVLVDNFEGMEPSQGTSSAPVLLAGSLFLVGEALALLSGGEAIPRSQ